MALRIAILASGSGSNAEAIMEQSRNGTLDVEVVCIISNTTGAGVLARAQKFAVPSHVLNHTAFDTRETFDAALIDILREYQPEYIVLAGYMRLLTPVFLRAFPNRVINIHPALSPSFPGAHGQRDAHAYGVKLAGCTVHFVDEKMDHGAIIIQAAIPILPDENLNNLKARILALEHKIYPQALQWLAQDRLRCEGRQVILLPGPHTPHTQSLFSNTCLIWPPLEEYTQTSTHETSFLEQQETIPIIKNTDTYSFDSFIVNRKNAFVLATVQELCNLHTQHTYNPFVIYGKSGTGKTHILRIISYYFEQLYDNTIYSNIVLNCSIDNILSLFTQNDIYSIISLYKIIIIDDLQQILHNVYNTKIQDILVRLIDICIQNNCQLVFACVNTPSSLAGLNETLRSRLEVGLVVELKEPDIDVRMRFAQKCAKQLNVSLERAHILLLAQRCITLRHLNGIILKIATLKKLSHNEINTENIENILQISGKEYTLSCENIITITANHITTEQQQISTTDIMSNKRQTNLVFARQIAMYLCRELLGMSYPALGKFFGGKDHSTVQHSIKKIKQLLVSNKETHILITELKKKCLVYS